MIQETDPARVIWLYAATQPGLWARTGPLLRVLDAAASADPALAELRNELDGQRRQGQGRVADHVAAMGALRPDLPLDRARDVVWTLCAQGLFDALVGTCGWSHDEFHRWLAEMLSAALLAP